MAGETNSSDLCSLCQIPSNKSPFPFNRKVEGTEVECAVEYQEGWRPEISPKKPDVERFLYEAHLEIYSPKNQSISERLAQK